MLFRRELVGLLLLLGIASLEFRTSSAQTTAATPTFKAEARIVLLDVVVTNGKGDSIPGLTAKDFQVSEDGRPQTLVFFQEHKGAQPELIKLPPMPPNVFTNFQPIKPTDSVNVLLLDWLNTQPMDQPYVRSEIIKYLKNAPAGTRLAIFTLGERLQLIQGFTSDMAELQASLSGKKGGATRLSSLLATDVGKSAEENLITLMRLNRASPMAIAAVQDEMAESAASDLGERVRITLEAFQQLARYLSSIPGRKNVIWFSGSFPISFFPDRGMPTEYAGELAKTVDILTPNQISIYPVSAEGLVVGGPYQAQNERGPSVRRSNFARAGKQQTMEQLAHDTGGRAFYNTNGLDYALATAIKEGSRYYSLAYTPTNKAEDGKYRHIQIKLVNGDYNLSYRRGYFAESKKQVDEARKAPQSDPLLTLLQFGLPDFDQILYKIRVVPNGPQPAGTPMAGGNGNLKGPLVRYGVDFAVSLDDLKLKLRPDGVRQDGIEELIVAYDRNGTPLNLAVKDFGLALQPKAYADFQKVGLPLHLDIDVPAGEAYLRTGIYDMNSGNAGTLTVPLAAVAAQQAAGAPPQDHH